MCEMSHHLMCRYQLTSLLFGHEVLYCSFYAWFFPFHAFPCFAVSRVYPQMVEQFSSHHDFSLHAGQYRLVLGSPRGLSQEALAHLIFVCASASRRLEVGLLVACRLTIVPSAFFFAQALVL